MLLVWREPHLIPRNELPEDLTDWVLVERTPLLVPRNESHNYKYTVDLHPVVGNYRMHIFEIQILLTKKLRSAQGDLENVLSVLFLSTTEGNEGFNYHEWFNSWHTFDKDYPEVTNDILDEMHRIRKLFPDYRYRTVK